YVLVGPGRWGSCDPWLGIPVKWGDISGSKVIVECAVENFRVDPSQGTHFFQNLTSFGVGYITMAPFQGDGVFDIQQLDSMSAEYESQNFRLVHFPEPLYIFVDGKNDKAIICNRIRTQ
ncbi:MAG: phosphoenolpyruvate synthase, partial [Mucinivorans sp.]